MQYVVWVSSYMTQDHPQMTWNFKPVRITSGSMGSMVGVNTLISNCSRATLIQRRSQSSLPNWERNGSFTLFRNQERRGSDTQFFRERSNERHSFLRGSPMQIKKPRQFFFKLRQILCNAPNCLINPCAALSIFFKKMDTYIHRHYEAAIMVDRWIGWSWSWGWS